MTIQSIINKHKKLNSYKLDHRRKEVNVFYTGDGVSICWHREFFDVIDSRYALCFCKWGG